MTSLHVATMATLLVIPVGTALAWILVNLNFPGKRLVSTLVLMPMVMPPVAIGLALLTLFSPRHGIGSFLAHTLGVELLLTWQAATIAALVVSLPLFIKAAEQSFGAVPRRYEDLARSFGKSEWAIFWQVQLPLARRGLIYGTLLAFARALGEFGATSIVAGHIPGETETLAVAIYDRIILGETEAARLLSAVSMVLAFALLSAGQMALRQDLNHIPRPDKAGRP